MSWNSVEEILTQRGNFNSFSFSNKKLCENIGIHVCVLQQFDAKEAQETGAMGPTGKGKRVIQPTLLSFMNVRTGLEGPVGKVDGKSTTSSLHSPKVTRQGPPQEN